MKTGDYITCKKSSKQHTIYQKYKILNITYKLQNIITGKLEDALYYILETDTRFNLQLNAEELIELFFTEKELRKHKLDKLKYNDDQLK